MSSVLPQLIWLLLTFIGIANEISNHGQQKTGRYDAGASILANCLIISLLYWGGFFNELLRKLAS